MAGGDPVLTQAVESYLSVRRTMGFALHSEGTLLQSFAKHVKTGKPIPATMDTI